ncbi:MAG TPA: LLM class flavin-dependent oxidoreductase [Micromonosporaceae bacterium]|nr:LLM class flavin-dependent oxidoreductase [Micromonosporaceae bacterium]HCU50996.1 LLM class flavin-dependent oxidoreductase [Micromonosporaceae bacterium]
MTVRVGIDLHEEILTADPVARRAILRHAASANLDHIGLADHVSFHDGIGFDGLISAALALADQDTVDVVLGVYQLALRHPLTVARQLATIGQYAPGRLVLGIGVGGEDRAEVSNCGIDPATRGRRLDEALTVLHALADGEPVTHKGRFFALDKARIIPATRTPIVVGGRGEAAANRAGRYGDGWLGIYVSPSRFAEMVDAVRTAAAAAQRNAPSWFGLNVWCGFDAALLASRMHELYQLPFDRFAKYCPTGTPEAIAEQLFEYVRAGCQTFTITAAVADPHRGIESASQVREHLLALASRW